MKDKPMWLDNLQWLCLVLMLVFISTGIDKGIIAIQRNQIEQAKVIANKLNSLEREIKEMKKTMETKPLILPEVRRTDDEAEVRR